MATLQGQSTSNPSSITQAAAVEALAGSQACVDEMVMEFARRRTFVLERLHAAGIGSIFHTYAFFLDKQSKYVTPVPDKRLDAFRTFTLADPVGPLHGIHRWVWKLIGKIPQ